MNAQDTSDVNIDSCAETDRSFARVWIRGHLGIHPKFRMVRWRRRTLRDLVSVQWVHDAGSYHHG